jgi:hypothetical protein
MGIRFIKGGNQTSTGFYFKLTYNRWLQGINPWILIIPRRVLAYIGRSPGYGPDLGHVWRGSKGDDIPLPPPLCTHSHSLCSPLMFALVALSLLAFIALRDFFARFRKLGCKGLLIVFVALCWKLI